jgi:hypothetical protein
MAEQSACPVAKIQLFSANVDELAEIVAQNAIISTKAAFFRENKCIFAINPGECFPANRYDVNSSLLSGETEGTDARC